jgi:hypothetical protein
MQQYHHIFKDVLQQTPEELSSQFAAPAAIVRAVQLVVPGMEKQAAVVAASGAGHKPAIVITGGGAACICSS